MKSRITIGIDPGKKTGIAVMENNTLRLLVTLDFWGTYNFVRDYPVSAVRAIIIEDTSDLPVFQRNRKADNWGAIAATGRNIGAVCREALLLAEGFQRSGYNVIKKSRNPKTPKLSSRQFRQLTGWMSRTNQHERDAATLLI